MVAKKLTSVPQLNAAVEYLRSKEVVIEDELEKHCGVGVVVTEQTIKKVAQVCSKASLFITLLTARFQLLRRYYKPSIMSKAFNKDVPKDWVLLWEMSYNKSEHILLALGLMELLLEQYD